MPVPGRAAWATRLGKAVEASNKSTATLESRVLVSARKLRDLKAAPADIEIKAIAPIERTARAFRRLHFRQCRQTWISNEHHQH